MGKYCLYCSKEIHSSRDFCCKECSNKSRTGKGRGGIIGYVKTTCKYCNKEFVAQRTALERGQEKYCSRKCFGLAKKTKTAITKICPNCNESFETLHPSKIYCNNECRYNHWKNGGCPNRKDPIISYCKFCGKSYNNRDVQGSKYCSKTCWQSDHNVTKICIVCGTSFTREKHRSSSNSLKYCSKECYLEDIKTETVKKICLICNNTYSTSLSRVDTSKVCSTECLRKYQKIGENNPNWQGGLSYEPYCPKFNKDLRERIRAFFNYECVLCGKSQEENGEKLSCHHVEYNKQACCDGKLVQFAALCRSCHTKTSGKNTKQRWMNMLHTIILEIYENRSYFTKGEWKLINKTL